MTTIKGNITYKGKVPEHKCFNSSSFSSQALAIAFVGHSGVAEKAVNTT